MQAQTTGENVKQANKQGPTVQQYSPTKMVQTKDKEKGNVNPTAEKDHDIFEEALDNNPDVVPNTAKIQESQPSANTQEHSAFKNVDFDTPILHSHDSDVEGVMLPKNTSGDIPPHLNVSPKGPRMCTIDDLKVYAKNASIFYDESIVEVQSPIQVPVQEANMSN